MAAIAGELNRVAGIMTIGTAIVSILIGDPERS
jgi:hypothetical protein